MLSRLADKGFLSSLKNGKDRLWKAEVTEEAYHSSEAKKIVNKIYGGSFIGLINAFYDGKGLSEEDSRELLEWIDNKTERKE